MSLPVIRYDPYTKTMVRDDDVKKVETVAPTVEPTEEKKPTKKKKKVEVKDETA